MAGPLFYQYLESTRENNIGKLLQYPSLISLDSSGVYDKKSYLGGKLVMRYQ